MKLSEFLRETELKLPVHLIIKHQVLNQPTAEGFVEVLVITKQKIDDGQTLYKIQFISSYDRHVVNDIHWVGAEWCAQFSVEKIFEE